MKKKATPSFPKSQAPWVGDHSPELSDAARAIALKLYKNHAKSNGTKLTVAQQKELATLFKNAEQGRTSAEKFMRALDKAIKPKNNKKKPDKETLENTVIVAEMKSFERASKKFNGAGRNMCDLGRGRIVVKSPKEMEKLYAILAQKDGDKFLENECPQNVVIAAGSFSDHLGEQSRSGYAGGLNFDLEIDNGKGRKGNFEVQVVPKEYLEICDQSHYIYEVIRLIEEDPEFKDNDECQIISFALVMANAAMFDEISIRTGFDKFRKAPMQRISEEDWKQTLDLLDIMRTAIGNVPGQQKERQKKIMDAITFSKTFVTNMYRAGQLTIEKLKPAPAIKAGQSVSGTEQYLQNT